MNGEPSCVVTTNSIAGQIGPDLNGVTTAEILNDPDIKSAIEQNQNKKEQIEDAAEVLKDEPRPIAAVKKVMQMHLRGTTKVFFSFKFKDERKATEIVKILRGLSPRIEFTFAGEFKQEIVGEKWNQHIRTCIANADWLILLLPDPGDDWDWCLFETGAFYGQMVSSKVEKLICLHHEMQSPPDQIKEFQAVPSNFESVFGFLKQVYLKPHPIPGLSKPIMAAEAKDILKDAARRIVKTIQPPQMIERRHYDEYILLKVRNPGSIDSPEDLKGAEILEISNQVMTIFGRNERPKTWYDLVKNVAESGGDTRWLIELSSAIREAGNGNLFVPVQATFQAHGGGKVYQPLLHAADIQISNGDFEAFHVILVEEVGAVESANIPKALLVLVTSLRLAFRFRWEIIEAYCRDDLTKAELPRLLDELKRLNAEAHSRGLIDSGQLIEGFEGDDRANLEEMLAFWAELMTSEEDGKLDVALRKGDLKTVRSLLIRLGALNKQFLQFASYRFAELAS